MKVFSAVLALGLWSVSVNAQNERLTFRTEHFNGTDYSIIPIQNLIISLIECHGCSLRDALINHPDIAVDPRFLTYFKRVEVNGLSKARLNAYREKMRIRYKETQAELKRASGPGVKPWKEHEYIDHYTRAYIETYKSRASAIGDSLPFLINSIRMELGSGGSHSSLPPVRP